MYYAIQEVGTDRFLPASKKGRGFTQDEPTSHLVRPPRLFLKPGPARQALNWWKKGYSYQLWDTRYNDYGSEAEDYVETKHVPERDSVNLEVVGIEAIVKPQKEGRCN